MEKNILLTIAYDGSGFCGWQRQPNARTVCGELEAVLSSIYKTNIKLDGTSRTDAGVHACGQCASFRVDSPIPTANLPKIMNNMLAESKNEPVGEIRILSAANMPEGFHARFSCKGKTYVYRIRNSGQPDVWARNTRCQILQSLDVQAMRSACGYILGTHDFACFQSAGSPKETTVRTVYRLEIGESEESGVRDIEITITGDGFLYNMVRIIAGTLIETGLGKRSPESMAQVVASCDRRLAGYVAPAQGLYLKEIYFDEAMLPKKEAAHESTELG